VLSVFRAAAAKGGKRAAFVEVEMCEGEGPARLSKKRLVLPRRNREVMAAVAAVAGDPSWAYPALVALLGAWRCLPQQ